MGDRAKKDLQQARKMLYKQRRTGGHELGQQTQRLRIKAASRGISLANPDASMKLAKSRKVGKELGPGPVERGAPKAEAQYEARRNRALKARGVAKRLGRRLPALGAAFGLSRIAENLRQRNK
jgi:hypothetical protein